MPRATSDPPRTRPGAKRRLAVDPAWLESEQRRAEQRARRDRSLVRHGIALVLVLVATWLVYVTREVPDPRYADGVLLAEQMDAAFRAVADGDLELPEEPVQVSPRVRGATVTVGDRRFGVLTGEAGGECYAHWWDAGLERRSRVLAAGIPCEPATIVTSIRPVHFTRLGPAVDDPEAAYGWEEVLREPIAERVWFLPAMVLGGGAALSIVTRIVTTLITGKPPRQLAREERHRKR